MYGCSTVHSVLVDDAEYIFIEIWTRLSIIFYESFKN